MTTSDVQRIWKVEEIPSIASSRYNTPQLQLQVRKFRRHSIRKPKSLGKSKKKTINREANWKAALNFGDYHMIMWESMPSMQMLTLTYKPWKVATVYQERKHDVLPSSSHSSSLDVYKTKVEQSISNKPPNSVCLLQACSSRIELQIPLETYLN